MTYGYTLGWNVSVERLTSVLLGGVFIIVGNYLPKCRQNYTVGIKLPWTLYDEENWNRTHRLGGKVWMLGGVLVLALGVVGLGNAWLILAVILPVSIVPVIYSFMYYMKHKEDR